MLLDTSFIVDLLRGKKSAVNKINELEAESIATNISAPSIFELFVGLSLTKKPSVEKKKIMDVLISWGNLALDSDSAVIAGKIHGELINEGQMIDPEDSMIAGIAIKHNESVLTRNTNHFNRIPDLQVEEY